MNCKKNVTKLRKPVRTRLRMTDQDIVDAYAKQITQAVLLRVDADFVGLEHCLFAVVLAVGKLCRIALSTPTNWNFEQAHDAIGEVLSTGTLVANTREVSGACETLYRFAKGFSERLYADRFDDGRVGRVVMVGVSPDGFYAPVFLGASQRALDVLRREFRVDGSFELGRGLYATAS